MNSIKKILFFSLILCLTINVQAQIIPVEDEVAPTEESRSSSPHDPYGSHPSISREFNNEIRELCDFRLPSGKLESIRTTNCFNLFQAANNGKISKDALMYTLKYFKANQGELKDSSCLGKGKPVSGIENSCQFVINDMNQRINGFSNRSPMHFIDLCDNSDSETGFGLLNTTYTNRGTGSANGSYADINGRHTTVVGAFLTGSLSTFVPYRPNASYENIGWTRRHCRNNPDINKCPIWRLELFGAHASNNNSEDSKPIHVSPYKSSWGCPSINVDDRKYLKFLHENGPSLVMNYGPEKYHSDSSIMTCEND